MRKKLIAIVLAVVVVGAAVATIAYLYAPSTLAWIALTRSPAPGRDLVGSIESGGLHRTYLLHLPPSYDDSHPVPLLLVFHGGYMTGKSMALLTGFSYTADTYGFIVAYPDGYDNHWNDGRNVTSASKAGVDDVGFVSNLIDSLSNQYRIDLTRVYATGFSDGGMFTHRLACQLANKIAAVAAVSGTLPPETANTCNPGRAVPILMIHGTSDPLVPFNGGNVSVLFAKAGYVLSLNDTVNRWMQIDSCPTTPAVTALPEVVNDGTTVVRESYGPCMQGTSVVAYIITGGGHAWPGGPQYDPVFIVGKASQNLDASQVIWTFFEEYSMPQSG